MSPTKLWMGGLLVVAGCGANAESDDVVPDVDATAAPDSAPPDAAPASFCAPEGDGPYWVEEGQPVSITLRCTGTVATDAAGLQFDTLPAGATYDAVTRTLSWTPALDQAAVWRLAVTATTTLETTDVVVGVADAYDAIDNVPVVDPATYTHEFGLPVFFVTWHSDDPGFCVDNQARDHVPADVMAFGHAYTGATMRCRGAASINFPKKSMTIDFGPGDRFAPPPGLDRFDGRHSLVLTQTFDDVSYLRTRLAFEVWNRVAPQAVQLQTGSAVVFVDGQYWGLYQMTDHVDDDLIQDQGFDGNSPMYKAYSHAGNLRAEYGDGSPKAWLGDGYEQKEGELLVNYDDLAELLTWSTSSSDEQFAAELDTKLATDDFIAWYVFATAIIAQDSYGKNSYLFHSVDPAVGADLRWHYAPWDMNHALGQNWQTFRIGAQAEGRFASWPTTTNGIWRRMATQPELATRIDEAFATALGGAMAKADVLALLDGMVDEVAVSAARDYRKWGTQMETWGWWSGRPDINQFDGEIAYLRQWISDRWDYLATLYPAN